MVGIRRDAPNPTKKRAASLTVLRELLGPIPDDLRGVRDRALLLVGFAGALRRSELARIQMGLANSSAPIAGSRLPCPAPKARKPAPSPCRSPMGKRSCALCGR